MRPRNIRPKLFGAYGYIKHIPVKEAMQLLDAGTAWRDERPELKGQFCLRLYDLGFPTEMLRNLQSAGTRGALTKRDMEDNALGAAGLDGRKRGPSRSIAGNQVDVRMSRVEAWPHIVQPQRRAAIYPGVCLL